MTSRPSYLLFDPDRPSFTPYRRPRPDFLNYDRERLERFRRRLLEHFRRHGLDAGNIIGTPPAEAG